LALIFVEEYNKDNGTNFTWIDNKSYEPGEPYDIVLFDGNEKLGLQAVRAVADSVREFKRPKWADAVVSLLVERFKAVKPRHGVIIDLNFHDPPKNDKDAKTLAYWLEFLIREKLKRERLSYYTYDARFDDHYLPHIKDYVSEIRILPDKGRGKSVCFITGASEGFPKPWLDDMQRVVIAVQSKQKKYTNVILLVDSSSFPVDDYDIPLIKEALAEMKFPEIWIVNNFSSNRNAIRVK
jgi:hypothetical protein